jgi:hypothetical protein
MKPLHRLWLFLTKPAGLVAWLGTGCRHVTQQEAQGRSETCFGCPGNVQTGKVHEIAVLTLKRRLGLHVAGEEKLKTCSGCGCPLKIKVWVGYEHIKSYQSTPETEKLMELNPFCWQI